MAVIGVWSVVDNSRQNYLLTTPDKIIAILFFDNNGFLRSTVIGVNSV